MLSNKNYFLQLEIYKKERLLNNYSSKNIEYLGGGGVIIKV